MTFVYPTPFTRYCDQFIQSDKILAPEICSNVTHSIVSVPTPHRSTRYQANFYKHIAADIVTETVFDYPYPYITEKTLRPLACKRMLIVIGAPGILEVLKSRGFKTFSDIIDESYDNIVDAETRFLAVINSIEKFCSIPLEKVKNYMLDNQEIFEHNFKTLRELSQREFQNI